MTGTYWHTDTNEICVVKPYLTGNRIIQNLDLNRIYLTPEWTKQKVSESHYETVEWIQGRQSLAKRPSASVQKLLFSVLSASDVAGFGQWLDMACHDSHLTWNAPTQSEEGKKIAPPSGWSDKDRTVIRYFLTCLWRHNAVLLPANSLFKGSLVNLDDIRGDQKVCLALDKLFAHRTGSISRALKNAILTSSGVKSLNDFVPDLLNIWLKQADAVGLTWPAASGSVGKLILQHQLSHTTVPLRHTVRDYHNPDARKHVKSLDTEFKGILIKDKGLEEWSNAAAEYYKDRRGSRTTASASLWAFLEYLVENPRVSRSIEEYFDRRKPPSPLFKYEENLNVINEVNLFHNWILDNILVSIDPESGSPLRPPWAANPLSAVKDTRRRSHGGLETNRRYIPSIVLEKCLDILTKDDWAWSKQVNYYKDQNVYERNFSVKRQAQNADWYPIIDPNTQGVRYNWSPVRAVAMFVLLRTAFRSFQVRMLDSGETDAMRVLLGQENGRSRYTQVANPNPLACQKPGEKSKGVVQLTFDETEQQSYPFLRISTNKTADIDKDAWEKGYDCPWAPDDVIEKLLWLRDWQERHNPMREPIKWTDVTELSRSKHEEQLVGMSGTFLFRDATSLDQRQPIKYGKLEVMWTMLCLEAERQLCNEGLNDEIGSVPLRLVDKETGRPIYDMHSIRVTHLSALYKRGLPIKVIMMISGHATVPMCLYYVKYGIAELRETINMAEANQLRTSQSDWASQMIEQQLEDLQPLLAYNEYQALVSFKEMSQDMIFMDTGLCTAGCGKCDVGVIEKKTSSRTFYGRVPGGRSNCCGCIHHVSGPPFIPGLNATWNVKSLRASDICKRRSNAEEKLAILNNEREETHEAFGKWTDLQKVSEEFERLTAEADQAIEELRNVSITITQCIQIQNLMAKKPSSSDGRFALIANDLDTVQMAFEQSTEFDLIDRVLQASVFFESTKSETTEKANLKRMRYYDQMLQRNGLTPTFWQMDEQTALMAGNALTNLLKARIGRKGTLDIMQGIKKLSEFNILPSTIYDEIEKISETPTSLQVKRPPLALT